MSQDENQQIDAATIKKIAHLARIHLEPQEQQAMLSDLTAILAWIDQLQAIDTTDIPPMTGPLSETTSDDSKDKAYGKAFATRRDDKVLPTPGSEILLKNAPEKKLGFFAVPKVVGE